MSRPLKKRILQSRPVVWLATSLVAALIYAIFLSCRVERRVHPASADYATGKTPGMIAFWHGRLVLQALLCPRRPRMNVITSQHTDGVLIARVVAWFGVRPIYGSSSRGARGMLLNTLKLAKRGENLGITPDGPRGPFQVAAPGATFIAAKTGYPLIPVTFSATRHKRFASWDRFMLPLPFGRIVYIAGEPMHVSANATDDELAIATAELQTRISTITREADAACGVAA